MSWVEVELVIVSLAAMLSPLTLMWSVLALVLSKRPLYTGVWFYLGALAATFAIGIAAAIVLGNAAASHHASTPKTWVAILDLIGALFLVVVAVRLLRRPSNPEKQTAMILQMASLSLPALKTISETNPSGGGLHPRVDRVHARIAPPTSHGDRPAARRP